MNSESQLNIYDSSPLNDLSKDKTEKYKAIGGSF